MKGMPIERAADHPIFELGGNTVTSLAAPARGATESALFRIDVPSGGGLQRHHHDHLDVFTVERGTVTFFLGQNETEMATGDSAVVPVGEWHHFVAGPGGATLIVAMLAGTKLVREDGTVSVPPWVS
jgi:quercetin dioxygenase-like cupin family protein